MGIFLTAEEEHATIRVIGQVQRVNFRSSVKKKAEELGITGYAKNETDGSVLIEAEGKMINITELARWCREGSFRENVQKILVDPGELQHYANFEIR